MSKASILLAGILLLSVILFGCMQNNQPVIETNISYTTNYTANYTNTNTTTTPPSPPGPQGNLSFVSHDCTLTGIDSDQGYALDQLTVSGTATGPVGASFDVIVYSPVNGLGDKIVVTCAGWSAPYRDFGNNTIGCIRGAGDSATTSWTLSQANYKNGGTIANMSFYKATIQAGVNILDKDQTPLNLASGQIDVPCPH